MELYYLPLSTYSQKVLIAFNEKGMSFDPKPVDLRSPAGQAAYREIYPIGKIPLLVPEPGHLVPESNIIIEYLEDHFPDAGTRLIPADAHAARQVRLMDRMNDLYLLNSSGLLFFQGLKPEQQRDQERIAEARRHLDYCLDGLEEKLSDGRQWLTGDTFTMADCSAVPALWLAQTAHPYPNHPAVKGYFDRAQQRASIRPVTAEAEALLTQFTEQLTA